MRSELNPRQWAVYNLLKENPDRYLTQFEIAFRLRHYYGIFTSERFHDSAARVRLTKDIQEINESDVIQKIIISNKNGVKLANSEEFAQYINAEFAAVFRKLERTRKKARKAGLNGQMRLVLNSERDTIQAFTDELSRLKAARLNAGLKLADVVRELRAAGEKGVDISLLSKMENGYCRPTDALLLKLAALYGAEPRFLINDEIVAGDGNAC